MMKIWISEKSQIFPKNAFHRFFTMAANPELFCFISKPELFRFERNREKTIFQPKQNLIRKTSFNYFHHQFILFSHRFSVSPGNVVTSFKAIKSHFPLRAIMESINFKTVVIRLNVRSESNGSRGRGPCWLCWEPGFLTGFRMCEH